MAQVQSLKTESKLAKKFKCNYCDRYFTRSEHRSRHELSHSNERPFRCSQCTSSFVRRDLLLRHCRTVHGSVQTPTTKKNRDDLKAEPATTKEMSTAMLMTEMHTLASTSPKSTYEQYGWRPMNGAVQSVPMPAPQQAPPGQMPLPSPNQQMPQGPQAPQGPQRPVQMQGMPPNMAHQAPSGYPSGQAAQLQHQVPAQVPAQMPQMPKQQQEMPDLAPLSTSDLLSIEQEYLPKVSFDPPTFQRVAPDIDNPVRVPQLGPSFDASFFVEKLKNRPSIRTDSFPRDITRLQLDRYLSAYFCFFHPIMPMFHTQTFDTHRANFYLMNAILAMGANLCHEETTAQLFSYNSRIILSAEVFQNQDQLSAAQTIILIIIFASYTGDMAGSEIANARTLLLRVVDQILDTNNLKHSNPAHIPSFGEWIQNQICTRTYFCTLIAITTMAAIFNASVSIDHMPPGLMLPCSEVIWNNQFDDEQEWLTRYRQELTEIPILTVGELLAILDNVDVSQAPLLNPFSVRILGNILFLRAAGLSPSCDAQTKKKLSRQMNLWQQVARDPYPGMGQGAMLAMANLPLISLMKPLQYDSDHNLPQSILGAMQCRQHPIIILSYTLLGTARLQLILDLSLVRESLNYRSAQRVAEAALTCLNSLASHNDDIIEQMTRIVIGSCDVIRATCLLGQRMYQAFLQSPLTGSIAGQCMVLAYELILGVIIWCYRVEERIRESNNGAKPLSDSLQKVYRWINEICSEAGIHKVYGTLAPALAESIAELFDAIKTWRLAEVMAMSLRLFARGLLSSHSEMQQRMYNHY